MDEYREGINLKPSGVAVFFRLFNAFFLQEKQLHSQEKSSRKLEDTHM